MPFGQRPIAIPGVGALIPATREVGEFHRNTERQRMSKPRQRVTLKQSRDLQVYIYNVGPFPATVPCASLGPKFIPALALEKVLLAKDLSVSEPLIVEGIPAEPYPSEGRNIWIEHEPEEFLGYGDNPGLHLALAIIGGAPQSNPMDDLRPKGVFVSEFPEQSKPGKSGSADDYALYEKWAEQVLNARQAFRSWAGEKCGEGHQAHIQGTWGMIKSPLYFTLARILKKTPMECAFLKDTEEASDLKACISCGATIPTIALKCKACGDVQVSQEAYELEMVKRRG